MPFKSKAQEHYLRINEPEIYRKWMDKYGSFKEAESFEAYPSFWGQKPTYETTEHNWEVESIDNNGEAVRLRCIDCGHQDYSYNKGGIHQEEDYGVNDPKMPIIVRGDRACGNGQDEACGECGGSKKCDYCHEYEEDLATCDLCDSKGVCHWCEGTGIDPYEKSGEYSHRWRAYPIPGLHDGDMQGIKLICKDCGVGSTFHTFAPYGCRGFPASCPCSNCNESYPTSEQMEELHYTPIASFAESFEAQKYDDLLEQQTISKYDDTENAIRTERLFNPRSKRSDREYLLVKYYYDGLDHTDECLYKAVVEGPIAWQYLNGLKSERPHSCKCSNEVCIKCKKPYDYWRSCDCTIYDDMELCSNCCPTGKCESYDYGAYRKERDAEKNKTREQDKKREKLERAIQAKEKMKSRLKIGGSITGVFTASIVGGFILRQYMGDDA